MALSLLMGSCGPAETGQLTSTEARPNVLLVVIDTLRADHCSLNGYPLNTTPFLDSLAAGGVAFETAYSPTSTTCPAHASLFTSQYPMEHGVVRNGLVLPPEAQTMAEVFGAAGYETAGFVSSFPVSRHFGLEQGFSHFDDDFSRSGGTFSRRVWGGLDLADDEGFDRSAATTTDVALDWLAAAPDRDRPLFLFVHYFDPHAPYRPDTDTFHELYPSTDGMTSDDLNIASYDAEIAGTDQQLARLVNTVREHGGPRQTLVMVTADHGEGLWDHGWRGHDRSNYEGEVRVPLVFHWPERLPSGLRVEHPAHLIDVLPTVNALLDLGADSRGHGGQDLVPHLLGSAAPDLQRPLFMQRPWFPSGRDKFDQLGPGYALRSGPWKLFMAMEEDRHELFDLSADPAEQHDVINREPQVAGRLGELLMEMVAHQQSRAALDATEVGAEDTAILRAMGYVGSADEGQDER